MIALDSNARFAKTLSIPVLAVLLFAAPSFAQQPPAPTVAGNVQKPSVQNEEADPFGL